jgi:predicted nucleic acid-binding protein
MSTRGTDSALIVVSDTDGLIAALHRDDANFARAKATVLRLVHEEAQTIFPVTTIAETVTTLRRKLNQPALAGDVLQRIANGDLAITSTDTDLLASAMRVFDPAGSKQNTLFDALVVATARKYRTKIIFSFDAWYERLGFTLATHLFEP